MICTKASLNDCLDESSDMSAPLYDDCLVPPDSAVFLELYRASEVSADVTPHGTTVTFAMTGKLSAKQGLLPSPQMQR